MTPSIDYVKLLDIAAIVRQWKDLDISDAKALAGIQAIIKT